MNKIIALFCFLLSATTAVSQQQQLKIITDFDDSFERYKIIINDTNNVTLAEYRFENPDTTFTYTFTDSIKRTKVEVFIYAPYHGSYFLNLKKITLSEDSLCTVYSLTPIDQKQIKDFKRQMDRRWSYEFDKGYGIFSKESPWMWCVGYTYQKDHLINLEVRKTGMDISGDHGDGQYAMTLLYAPYLIIGGDATVYPDFQFAPKAGIGIYAWIVNANLSYIAYNTDFNKFNSAIVPEVGLSLPFGFLHLDYGYNFYLEGPFKFDSNNHRLSLRASWFFKPKKVW